MAGCNARRTGRLRLQVGDVLGDEPSGWAEACIPLIACPYGGQALAVTTSARVMVSGSPVVTGDTVYRIVGCPHRAHHAATPCTTGRWLTGSTRVLSEGRPLAIASGTSACEPGGEPMTVLATQERVTAS